MKHYEIGGLLCTITGDDEVVGDNYAPFQRENAAAPLLFELAVQTTSKPPSVAEWQMIDEYADDSNRFVAYKQGDKLRLVDYLPGHEQPISVVECNEQFNQNTLWLLNTNYTRMALDNAMMLCYTCAGALRHDTLLIHSSVVVHGGIAYLFLGKSGTGKSTHTGLWLQHIPHTHRLNDDNPVIKIENNEVVVYGSPWSGKTACYLDERYPVGAFVRLWQAPHNKINHLKAAMSFASLLPTVSILPCSAAVGVGVRKALTQVVEQSSVYRLECLPDEAAAQLSFKTITQP